jgi:hypothetical protein
VSNVNIHVGALYASPDTGGNSVGALAGVNVGVIKGCTIYGRIDYHVVDNPREGIYSDVGGVVGSNLGAAFSLHSRLEGCTNNVTITSTASETGGITGWNDTDATVDTCMNFGAVTGSGAEVGGITGSNEGILQNCGNAGTIRSLGYASDYGEVGGLVGWNGSGVVRNCFNKGSVSAPGTGQFYVAGLVGLNDTDNSGASARVENSYSSGMVSMDSGTDVYAICAWVEPTCIISNCYWLAGSAAKGVTTGEIVNNCASFNGLPDMKFADQSKLVDVLNAWVQANISAIPDLMRWKVAGDYPILTDEVIKKSGLEYFSAFFDAGNPAELQGAATFYQDAVTANPQDYTSRVYAAFTQVFNLINDAPLKDLMKQFGFQYEDLGGEDGWDLTGDFNFAGAPPSNQAIDTLWTRCHPTIDEAYTLLDAIPASWTGSAEVSQSVFPVDETVYVDYPDVVSAKAMLKAMRSFLNTVRAYDMTVNYATADWPVSLPVQAITVDGNSNDWANIPVQLVGEEGDALHSVKGCRSGNTVYLLIEKDALQPNFSAYLDGSVKVKLDGQQNEIDFRCRHLSAGNEVEVWFRTGNMTDEAVGTAVLNGETLELALTVPQAAGTMTDAGLIDWVWYGWRGVDWEGESELDFFNGNHPADSLLALFPDVLKSVRNPDALTLAKTDLSLAIDLGQDAGTRIKNRTGGEMHFYEYDPEYEADHDEFMDRLAKVKSSLTEPTVFNIGTDNEVTVHLGAFYTAPFVTRGMLPAYRADALLNDPTQGTFPDPTFGGVFPNLTRSVFAEWITGDKNLVLQANGGVLKSYTSQDDNNLYAATNLTDGAVGTSSNNWISAINPGTQTFEYSFAGDQSANLTSLTLVNATRAQINCKDFQVLISANGSNAWTKVAEGTLANNGDPQPFSLSGQTAKRVRLVITSGYVTANWELAEFELYGYFDAPLRPADVWYTAHGIERSPSETWEDVDNRIVPGKGTTLLREYIADTDPNDINSVFRVKNVDPGPPVVIRFELASTQRAYTLQYTDDLSSGIWHDVPGTVRHAGTGGEDSLSDDTVNVPATKRRFYRMKVELP